MAKSLEALPERSRYSYEQICLEIESRLSKRGMQARAAEACLLATPQFNKRLHRTSTERFEIEHLGAIADFLRAPPGWPLIPWHVAERMEAALKNLHK